ncbi:efflux RND transporter periplasmic adaptor subunit [Desulfobacterota bacterium AH_259_B03_O07]|nr:efflux RND transporter periplasmic adaptor subunit [Desulfobacterota bacterium AH_259_B03_O07]
MSKFQPERNLSKEWRWFIAIIITFVALTVGLYFRMISVRSAAYEAEKEKSLRVVRVQPLIATEVWKTTSFLARIEGGQSIDVRAQVGGWVVSRDAVRGQEVEKNEILIVLEDERETLKLKEAESRLKSARANLKDLRRRLEQTKTLFDKGIVSRGNLDSLSNQVEAESANFNALEASYKLMKWDVEHLVVRSPISGRIVEVLPDIGQEVSVGDLLVKMVNSSQERVIAGVGPRWARLIEPGMTVKLSTTSDGNVQVTEGKIIGVSPDMDSSSGTYEVEAEIVVNEYDWWPGEIVNMQVPVELLKGVIILPRTAVLSDSKDLFIFVYKDGKALKVPVNVTWLNETEGAVPLNMIPEGTQIIVEGHVGLAGGQLVRSME